MLILLGGCRTYGGYGTEEATYAEIQKANVQFADALNRAQSEYRALETLARTNPALRPSAEHYAQLIAFHEALLLEHVAWAEQVDVDDYRDVSRVLGAIVAEEQRLAERYGTIIGGAEQLLTADSTMLVPGVGEPDGRYYVVPPYFVRVMEEMNAPLLPAQ